MSREGANNLEACRREHLLGQVEEGEHDSIPHEVDVVHEDGSTTTQNSDLHFQLVQTSHGLHRAHNMPTIETAGDLSATADLAFQVQYASVYQNPENDPPPSAGTVDIFPDGDLEWIRPFSLAPFDTFQKHLMCYQAVEASPYDGCERISDARHAAVRVPIMDANCPVLHIIQHLHRRGWKSVDGLVVHTSTSPGQFDAQEATKFRTYFQCLASIGTCLPLTSELPSRQPIAFYELLLRGKRAEPYGRAKDYQVVLNKEFKKKGGVIEFPPLDDEPPGAVLGDDPDGIICGPASTEPQDRKPRTAGVRNVNRGGQSSGSSDPPPGVIIPCPPGPVEVPPLVAPPPGPIAPLPPCPR